MLLLFWQPLAYAAVAASGSFAVNGNAATPNSARSLPAAKGTFAVNGVAAAITSARIMSAVKGTFLLAGQPAALNRGIQGSRNTGVPMTYGEAYQTLFPRVTETLG